MKKTIFIIALMALMFMATSGFGNDNPAMDKGAFAPELTVSNSSSELTLSQLRGKNVLVNFWSASDAASRIDNNSYAAWASANSSDNLQYIAVNIDDDPELFEAIAKADGLDKEAQYAATGEDVKRIISDFRLAEGYGAVLIGPDGRIRAFNPTKSELSSLI